MRTLFGLLMAVLVLMSAACVTTEEQRADGSTVKTKAPAPGSMELAGQSLVTVGEALKARKVTEAKSFTGAEWSEDEPAAVVVEEGEWPGTPNPLDVPGSGPEDRTEWRPAAYGYFGPFGQGPVFGP